MFGPAFADNLRSVSVPLPVPFGEDNATAARRRSATGACLRDRSSACPPALGRCGEAERRGSRRNLHACPCRLLLHRGTQPALEPALTPDVQPSDQLHGGRDCLLEAPSAHWVGKPAAGAGTGERTISLLQRQREGAAERKPLLAWIYCRHKPSLSAKEQQAFPRAWAGISEPSAPPNPLQSRCGLLCSALPASAFPDETGQARPRHRAGAPRHAARRPTRK